MEYPKVSVIIPTYNRPYLLSNALESVIEQNYPHLEILVVDGGCCSDTYNVVKDFSVHYPYIHYLKNTQKEGLHGAKNTAINQIQGELFTFLDDDDILLQNALHRLTEIYIQKNKVYGIVLSNRLRSDNKELSGIGIEESREVDTDEFWYGKLSGKFFGVVATSLIGKDRFDEELKGRDKVFWNKIYAKSKIFYIHQPMRIYSIHSDSLTASLYYEPLVEAKSYEKEISFLENLKIDNPQKNDYLATLHNEIAKLYLAGNKKFKAKEHLKKSLECKLGLEAFSIWLRSLA